MTPPSRDITTARHGLVQVVNYLMLSWILQLPAESNSSDIVGATHLQHRRQDTDLIGIVGGGIAGAASALALQQNGFRVLLMERDEYFGQRKPGYGVTLQQGVYTLRELGLLEEALRLDVQTSSHYIFSPNGTIVAFFGRPFAGLSVQHSDGKYCKTGDDAAHLREEPRGNDQTTAMDIEDSTAMQAGIRKHINNSTDARNSQEDLSGQDFNAGTYRKSQRRALWKKRCGEAKGVAGLQDRGGGTLQKYNIHMPRQELRRILMSKLDKGTVRWGCRVEHVTLHKEHVTVHLHGGDAVNVRLLVGADGIRSKVRRSLLCDSPRHPLVASRTWQVNDGANRLFCMPFEKNITFWQLSFPETEERLSATSLTPEALMHEALTRCSNWHAPIPEMIASTQPGDISGHGVYDCEPISPRRACIHGQTACYATGHSSVHAGEHAGIAGVAEDSAEIAGIAGIHAGMEGFAGINAGDNAGCNAGNARDICSARKKASRVGNAAMEDSYFKEIARFGRKSEVEQDEKSNVLQSGKGDVKQDAKSNSMNDVKGIATPSLGCCDRVVLIGDAAHAMAPFKAQGANQALLDAIALTRALMNVRASSSSTQGDAQQRESSHLGQCSGSECVQGAAQGIQSQIQSKLQSKLGSWNSTPDAPGHEREMQDRLDQGMAIPYANEDTKEKEGKCTSTPATERYAEGGWMGGRFASILFDELKKFEGQMLSRSREKVYASRRTLEVLHMPKASEPVTFWSRGVREDAIARLREAGIGMWSAAQEGDLDAVVLQTLGYE